MTLIDFSENLLVPQMKALFVMNPYFSLLLVFNTITSTSLRGKCPYSELFWSVFPRIQTEYGEILRISPYSVRMRKNLDQNNSEYRQFLRSALG